MQCNSLLINTYLYVKKKQKKPIILFNCLIIKCYSPSIIKPTDEITYTIHIYTIFHMCLLLALFFFSFIVFISFSSCKFKTNNINGIFSGDKFHNHFYQIKCGFRMRSNNKFTHKFQMPSIKCSVSCSVWTSLVEIKWMKYTFRNTQRFRD